MVNVTTEDMIKRSARKHVIAEELNIVVSGTRSLSQARHHQLERLKQRLRDLEAKL